MAVSIHCTHISHSIVNTIYYTLYITHITHYITHYTCAGFDDTLKLLERLSVYVFDLPVDVAITQFQQIEEAF